MLRTIGYRVRVCVQGELDPAWWSGLFAGLDVSTQPGGTTLLIGELPDQAAVHGLLTTIRDLGLSLLAVETVAEPGPEGETVAEPDPGLETGGSR